MLALQISQIGRTLNSLSFGYKGRGRFSTTFS